MRSASVPSSSSSSASLRRGLDRLDQDGLELGAQAFGVTEGENLGFLVGMHQTP